MRRSAAWLNLARLGVLGLGIPTLVYWAWREQALDLQHGWNSSLFAGLLLSQCSVGLYALRFRIVMNIVGINLGLTETLRINLLSLFYQFFVPLSVGADVTKFVKLKAREHGALASVSGIVLDHFIGLVTLIAVAAALFAWRRPISLDLDLGLGVALALAAMVAAGILAVRYQRRSAIDFKALAARLAERRAAVLGACTLSLIMQGLLATAIFVGSHGWGLDIDYFDILFVMTSALIFQAIPINLAGVGPAEVAGTGLYVALGLPMPTALLLVSLLYGYRLVNALIGGLWDLVPEQSDHLV